MTKKRFFVYFLIAFLALIGYVFYFYKDSFEKLSKDQFESSHLLKNKETLSYGVSASHPLAVEVGIDVLEKGGNAVDAAIAVSYALGVVEPYGSGIGGGGGMLIKPGDSKEDAIFIDYREVAPTANQQSAGQVGVPGFVKGMEIISESYGTMAISELIEPSIELAEDGFEVSEDLHNRLENAQYRLPVNQLPHLFPNGHPIDVDDLLKQKDLAKTLKGIQEEGSDGFYAGEVATSITHSSAVTNDDLLSYEVVEREPVYGEFSGFDIMSAPPPFAGITLIQSLQMIDLLNAESVKDNQVDYMYMISKVTNTAYQDRFETLGDPHFVEISNDTLTSKDHAQSLIETMDMDHLSQNEEEHESTTHFVVIDSEGTVASATNTLSNFFGSGIFTEGFFLNNNLDNFGTSAVSPNAYEPGKRARTFTAPTIIYNDELMLGIGTPGGNRIPAMLVEVLVPYLKYGETLEDIVEEPRFYAQDGKIFTENLYPPEIKQALNNLGYQVEFNSKSTFYGAIQALLIDYEQKLIYGVGDKRRNGTWMVK